jgi:iron complex transport system ATP-binding protein
MILQVDGLGFSYRRGAPLLRDVNLARGAGHVCCLLGPNGAGKTSLIRCLVGINRPSAGRVRIDGMDVAATPPRRLARHVAYVPQSTETVFAFTVLDVVTAGRTAYVRFGTTPSSADRLQAVEALDWVGIRHLASRPFNRVSGGERQLALIARALSQATPLLVLDEPTSALDYGNQVRVLQIVGDLARAGKAVLMSSHAPWQAFDCADSVLLLRAGAVVSYGPPTQMLDGEALSDLHGVPIDVVTASTSRRARRVCIPDLAAIDTRRNV